MKVLMVVEDDLDMRLIIRITLETDPRLQIVGEAGTAEEAIEIARSENPGLIILDNSLEGEMTGLEAAPILKDVAPHAKVLLFTAYDLRSEAKREPAIDAFLRKDHLKDLLPVILRLLDLAPANA